MHQAAEQVGFSAFSVFHLSFSPFSFSLLYSLRSLLSSSQVKVLSLVSLQGCAKAVSLIKAVRPTSVDDIDINGYQKLLLCFVFIVVCFWTFKYLQTYYDIIVSFLGCWMASGSGLGIRLPNCILFFQTFGAYKLKNMESVCLIPRPFTKLGVGMEQE